MDFGPWIVWGKQERPAGLADTQRIEVVFIHQKGHLMAEGTMRSAGAHFWERGITLAYRVEKGKKKYVLRGWGGGMFTSGQHDAPYTLTYVLDQDGEVVSCKMERL